MINKMLKYIMQLAVGFHHVELKFMCSYVMNKIIATAFYVLVWWDMHLVCHLLPC